MRDNKIFQLQFAAYLQNNLPVNKKSFPQLRLHRVQWGDASYEGSRPERWRMLSLHSTKKSLNSRFLIVFPSLIWFSRSHCGELHSYSIWTGCVQDVSVPASIRWLALLFSCLSHSVFLLIRFQMKSVEMTNVRRRNVGEDTWKGAKGVASSLWCGKWKIRSKTLHSKCQLGWKKQHSFKANDTFWTHCQFSEHQNKAVNTRQMIHKDKHWKSSSKIKDRETKLWDYG